MQPVKASLLAFFTDIWPPRQALSNPVTICHMWRQPTGLLNVATGIFFQKLVCGGQA